MTEKPDFASQVVELKKKLAKKEEALEKRDIEIKRLTKENRELLKLEQDDGSAAGGRNADDEHVDSEGEDTNEPVFPMWDGYDELYKCLECTGEVDEDVCVGCGREYLTPDPNPLSCSTVSQATLPDRSLRRRGSTPMFDVGEIRVPDRWIDREDEYCELIQRGATQLMCDTFHLTFSEEEGIFAIADEELREELAGPAIKDDDVWKIYLGRRLELDVEDHDGSEFIEGLLEDAVLFTTRNFPSKWQTKREGPNLWVTRPGNEDAVEVGNVEREDEHEDAAESGNEGDGGSYESDESGNGYIEDLPTWVHVGGCQDPNTGEAIVEHKYYDTYEDELSSDEMDVEEDGLKTPKSEDGARYGTSGTLPDETMDGYSSCDSDFDSDDELSGDEITGLVEDYRHYYKS
ncbi:hypothetical protein FA15DRAFT_674330 [Coprinopsis marcescibilis]|uniref:DUF8191 domain-containing protein n=1 Tax=Coprinopsis marcescibilis TaxID=230819 RepID=A0A5C3KHR3_COPMA|nr:hypothetical protein FA15DRAFT_674330 [Coprinopsis marcescibilis]